MKRTVFRATVVMVMMTFSMGFISSASNASVPKAKKATTYKLAQYPPSGSDPNIPLQIAYDQGFFTKNHLNVTMSIVASSAELAPILGGEELVGGAPASAAITAIADGAALKIVMTTFPHFPWQMWCKPSIKSISQLRGATVAVTAVTGSFDSDMHIVIPALGIPITAVNLVPTGTIPNTIAAALAGSVECTPVEPGPASDELNSVGWHMLFNPNTYSKTKRILDDGGGAYVASDQEIKNNPQEIQDYVNAIMESIAWMKTHKVGTEKEFQAAPQFAPSSDIHGLEVQYAFYNQATVCNPIPVRSEFARGDAILAKSEPAVSALNASNIIDQSFVKKAVANHIGCAS